MPTEVGGFNETEAAAIFEPISVRLTFLSIIGRYDWGGHELIPA
jgi:hypothetical protein